MVNRIIVIGKAKKQLDVAPPQVKTKFKLWLKLVQEHGLMKVRRSLGWHDEPLNGKREGQRSIRLNIQRRAIYVIKDDNSIEFVEVQEVTPHDY